MRIALTTSLVSSLHPAQANGPHAVVIDVARGLMTRGHQVRVYAAEGSNAPGIDIVGVPVDRAAAHAAVRMGRVPAADAVAALNRAFGGMFEMVRSHAPDVVSQHAFDAAAFQLASGLPVLHTLHLPPMDSDIIGAVRGAEGHLATVSMAAQRAWEAAARREVAVLPNGVRPLEPVGGVTVPVALIAGRISPEKGTDTAIRVARRAGLAVLVVGEVYDSDYYTAVVEPLLCPGEWMGPVSREELFQLMARSAVLLMPVGWDEAFGLVAAEAQMAGCPVVAYRRGALPEVVPDGVGGVLVDPDDEDALVAAISLARGLDRRAIRGRARRELGVNRMINAYERDLMAVAADHSSARLAS